MHGLHGLHFARRNTLRGSVDLARVGVSARRRECDAISRNLLHSWRHARSAYLVGKGSVHSAQRAAISRDPRHAGLEHPARGARGGGQEIAHRAALGDGGYWGQR